jgi:murein DD-endopeptidase MepM/ murein hydrolase activator NlpD
VKRRLAFALVVVMAFLLSPSSVAVADPQTDLERIPDEIAALEGQIAAAEAQKGEAAGRLSEAQAEVSAVLGELDAAQTAVDEVRGRISTEETNLAELERQLQQLERDLAETRADLASSQRDLEAQVVQMYMTASSSAGATMLAFDSAAELQIGLQYSETMANFSEDAIDGFVALRSEEERQQSAVDGQRSDVQSVLVTLEADRVLLEDELDTVRRLQAQAEEELVAAQNILNSINADIRSAEQHKDGLEAESSRLEDEIKALQETSGAGDTSPGVIGWPVSGPVTSAFGYRTHPIFGTKRLHTGIDIGVGYGTPIVAAESGVVILAGGYGGYGNAVVIDHGGGLSTLYAHQSSIAISNGSRVDRGQAIGYVGCTGYCTGAHLHFETRDGGVPVDPMRYLG